jgi:hypothetical protein
MSFSDNRRVNETRMVRLLVWCNRQYDDAFNWEIHGDAPLGWLPRRLRLRCWVADRIYSFARRRDGRTRTSSTPS